jgi:hypothetical protein
MTPSDAQDAAAEPFDPAARELCPDGACLGVLGSDGRCRVCGRSGEGVKAAPRDAARPPAAAAVLPSASAGDEGGAFADDERRLCPDGACVGLVGPDGRCKVCGATGAAT